MTSNNSDKINTRYQDYVIRDGLFIGQFEEMYRNSAEVPWHQDQTVQAVFSDHTVTLLHRLHPKSMLDVGCGLGYMASRLKSEIPELSRVIGLEVSETAVEKARNMFPEIEFHSGTLAGWKEEREPFDVVISKDVLWYVLDDLPGYLAALVKRSRQWVYIGQAFPQNRPFLGEDILPDASGLLNLVESQGYHVRYFLVERDAEYDNREYAHLLIELKA